MLSLKFTLKVVYLCSHLWIYSLFENSHLNWFSFILDILYRTRVCVRERACARACVCVSVCVSLQCMKLQTLTFCQDWWYPTFPLCYTVTTVSMFRRDRTLPFPIQDPTCHCHCRFWSLEHLFLRQASDSLLLQEGACIRYY